MSDTKATEEPKPLIEFPSSFFLKVIGTGPHDFEEFVMTVLQKHLGSLDEVTVTSRPSKEGKYLAVSAEFMATSQAMLDDIYRELSSNPRVKMTL